MRKIVIRMPNWVGDVVMATPALRALRGSFPGARITAVINSGVHKVIRGSAEIDRTIQYKRDGSAPKVMREFLACTSAIRKEKNDLALILPNSFSSALMMRIAGVPERVGYRRDMRRFLLTSSLQRPKDENGRFLPQYMAKYYLRLCRAAGAENTGDIRPHLDFAESDMQSAMALLCKTGMKPEKPYFLLHPDAGYGPSKLWPAGHFSALTRMLHDYYDAQVAFIGSKSAGALVADIRENATNPTFDLTACGIDLHLLKCVVKRCRLLVSTDSGPRHYGIALGVPTVCLIGPTSPAYTDSGLPHDNIIRTQTDCGPCQKKNCRTDHRCMVDISPERVFLRCKELLIPHISQTNDRH